MFVSTRTGFRAGQEDIALSLRFEKKKKACAAVLDGHGGVVVAQDLATKLKAMGEIPRMQEHEICQEWNESLKIHKKGGSTMVVGCVDVQHNLARFTWVGDGCAFVFDSSTGELAIADKMTEYDQADPRKTFSEVHVPAVIQPHAFCGVFKKRTNPMPTSITKYMPHAASMLKTVEMKHDTKKEDGLLELARMITLHGKQNYETCESVDRCKLRRHGREHEHRAIMSLVEPSRSFGDFIVYEKMPMWHPVAIPTTREFTFSSPTDPYVMFLATDGILSNGCFKSPDEIAFFLSFPLDGLKQKNIHTPELVQDKYEECLQEHETLASRRAQRSKMSAQQLQTMWGEEAKNARATVLAFLARIHQKPTWQQKVHLLTAAALLLSSVDNVTAIVLPF